MIRSKATRKLHTTLDQNVCWQAENGTEEMLVVFPCCCKGVGKSRVQARTSKVVTMEFSASCSSPEPRP